MDVDTVRDRAAAFCAALDAGDIEAATEHLSPELQRNLGEVLALLPMPSTGSTVESVERGGPGCNVVVLLRGETDEVELHTRWKDRDGVPTIVEVSHLSREVTPDAGVAEGEPAVAEAS
jgi:hypothetical protein